MKKLKDILGFLTDLLLLGRARKWWKVRQRRQLTRWVDRELTKKIKERRDAGK